MQRSITIGIEYDKNKFADRGLGDDGKIDKRENIKTAWTGAEVSNF